MEPRTASSAAGITDIYFVMAAILTGQSDADNHFPLQHVRREKDIRYTSRLRDSHRTFVS